MILESSVRAGRSGWADLRRLPVAGWWPPGMSPKETKHPKLVSKSVRGRDLRPSARCPPCPPTKAEKIPREILWSNALSSGLSETMPFWWRKFPPENADRHRPFPCTFFGQNFAEDFPGQEPVSGSLFSEHNFTRNFGRFPAKNLATVSGVSGVSGAIRVIRIIRHRQTTNRLRVSAVGTRPVPAGPSFLFFFS